MASLFSTKTFSTNQKIEDSLIIRHKYLKHKIDMLRQSHSIEALRQTKAIPTINPTSRRIVSHKPAHKDPSPSLIKRTQEILQSCSFLPKSVSIALSSLPNKPSFKAHRYNAQLSSVKIDMPITYPSLPRPQSCELKKNTDEISLPSDIIKRNELLISNEKEINIKAKEPRGVYLRNIRWEQRKFEKINKKRKEIETEANEACTFRPEIIKETKWEHAPYRAKSATSSYSDIMLKKNKLKGKESPMRSERTNSGDTKPGTTFYSVKETRDLSERRYFSLGPVEMDVRYSSGFSESFRNRAIPMIDYKTITFDIR